MHLYNEERNDIIWVYGIKWWVLEEVAGKQNSRLDELQVTSGRSAATR